MPSPIEGSIASSSSTPSIFVTLSPPAACSVPLAKSILQFVTEGANKPAIVPPVNDNVLIVLSAFCPCVKYFDDLYVTPILKDGTRMELDYLSDEAFLRIYKKDNELYSLTPLPEGAKVTGFINDFVVNKNIQFIWDRWAAERAPGEHRDIALRRFYNCIAVEGPCLDLSKLKLSSVPRYFPNHILKLEISNNRLTSLPCLHEKLEYLDAGNNLISDLPAQFTSSLFLLYIKNNLLQTFPAFPETLRYIDVSGNKLTDFDGLPLTALSLNIGNNPHCINKTLDFRCFRDMERLFINGLGLKKIPPLPPQIMSLDLSDNPLVEIPSLTQFKKLTILDINNTQIRKIPPLPESITNLHADDNYISSFDAVLPSLKALSLEGNRLSIFRPKAYPKLTHLLLCDNKITHIEGPFSEEINTLNVSYNLLREIPPLLNKHMFYASCAYNRLISPHSHSTPGGKFSRDEGNLYNFGLRSVRRMLNLTERNLAEALQVRESEIKRTEDCGDDVKLDAIKHYVAAIGCKLNLKITLPTGEERIIQV